MGDDVDLLRPRTQLPLPRLQLKRCANELHDIYKLDSIEVLQNVEGLSKMIENRVNGWYEIVLVTEFQTERLRYFGALSNIRDGQSLEVGESSEAVKELDLLDRPAIGFPAIKNAQLSPGQWGRMDRHRAVQSDLPKRRSDLEDLKLIQRCSTEAKNLQVGSTVCQRWEYCASSSISEPYGLPMRVLTRNALLFARARAALKSAAERRAIDGWNHSSKFTSTDVHNEGVPIMMLCQEQHTRDKINSADFASRIRCSEVLLRGGSTQRSKDSLDFRGKTPNWSQDTAALSDVPLECIAFGEEAFEGIFYRSNIYPVAGKHPDGSGEMLLFRRRFESFILREVSGRNDEEKTFSTEAYGCTGESMSCTRVVLSGQAASRGHDNVIRPDRGNSRESQDRGLSKFEGIRTESSVHRDGC
ncbi:hypothetical protein B0H16DRAFT_1460318 [Mycena metata]|uniref:Uncharacterized protein n=1 Tax=Mycena metata TaxID=1033252 RepID=A0AAD7NAE1_9AGAR|nr:hypothetical protein B0H16DRAFT_1460318 [Mycena metata]